MDRITELELQGLLDRDRIMALMNRYFATVDDANGLDAEWARSIFSEDVRVEHRGFTLEGLEDLAVGNRFVRDGWDRTFHVSTNAQVELDGDRAHLRAQLLAIHVHPESTPQEPYIIANVFEADVLRTLDGWRFQTLNLRPVWSTGQSHFDIEANGQ
jgi:SnoaL-like protein